MKLSALPAAICLILLASCNTQNVQPQTPKDEKLPIEGTWKLLKGTLVENGITTITDYTKNISFIKIIDNDHFAFLQHNPNKDSAANFSAGGGAYTLHDSSYTEHLEYCSAKEWEGNDFSFIITIHNDTLIQRGVEKVVKAGVNRVNTEMYVRLKK